MRITSLDSYHTRIPLKPISDGGIAPYISHNGPSGMHYAESLLIAIRTDDGITGWGETNTGFGRAIDETFVREWWSPKLIGKDPTLIRPTMASLDEDAPFWPQYNRPGISCAIEMALWDLLGRALATPISTLLGGRIRNEVSVAFCFGIADVPTTVSTAARICDEGYSVLKTKIGLDMHADLDRVQAIVDATEGQLRLRLDANEGYSRVEALELVGKLAGMPIEYVEQPLAIGDYAGMASLLQRSPVPVAVNEDTYMPGGLMRAIEEKSTDAAVVDVEATGGVSGLVELAGFAHSNRVPLAHHCAFDTGVKTAMMLQVVSALPAFVLASDSTYSMHLEDVLEARLETVGGRLLVPTGPGIGVDVNEDAVRSLRADQ